MVQGMPDLMEKIKKIKKKHQQEWLQIDGVVAVGIGNLSDGTPGIIVSVKKNAREIRRQIPETIEGVGVKIQETGELKAL